MKNINIKDRAFAILTAGFLLVGSCAGTILAKDSKLHRVQTDPVSIESLLEDENIQNITVIDEEIAEGKADIISKDKEFRKQIMNLEYYESSGETDLYNETLNWLRENFKDTAEVVLLESVKGAIAEDENKSTSDITLTPAPDYNEDSLFLQPKGVAGIKNDFHVDGYTIESKALNNAVNLCANIQDMNFNEMNAKDIIKLYDEVITTSKMAIASGASRHDDKINEKNSKKYIKKNFSI